MIASPLDLIRRVLRCPDAPASGTVASITTDSRRVERDSLFFAIRGENFDGHDFVGAALESGAVAAVVAHGAACGADEHRLLRVPDPLLALGRLAAWHRRRLRARVVAVTGSVGKTTTKDLIASVLGRRHIVEASRASYNNELGLPLTLLSAGERTEYLVVEMAMRGSGQIAYLAEIAAPDVVVITCIGSSHMELLGSREAIAAAKAEALDYLPVGGAAVLPAKDDFAAFLRGRVPPGASVIPFGLDLADARAVTGAYGGADWDGEPRGRLELRLPGEPSIQTSLTAPGRHNAENALAAAAVGLHDGLSSREIADGVEGCRLSAMRMAIRRMANGAMLIDDAYNASTPEAMEAALAVLRDRGSDAPIAVLGDMLELGEASIEAHRRVGRAAAQVPGLRLVAIGSGAGSIAESAREAGIDDASIVRVTDHASAAAAARRWLQPGSTLLIKGSRGMALEKVVAELMEGAAR